MNENPIELLTVYDAASRSTIFSSDEIRYTIPLYQRAFSWTDLEIGQLIDDILEHDGNIYYIGALVVYQRGRVYEVIDGQQRLTTLMLIMITLNTPELPVKNILSFDCRKKADNTFAKMIEHKEVAADELDDGLMTGLQVIRDKFSAAPAIDKTLFLQKLSQVRLYRIRVPEHTDLNRYFEIMNTRGEQLEQHDILKASLMSELKSEDARTLFAKIWEACSDMTGYVQMHFAPALRDELFGSGWNDLRGACFEPSAQAQSGERAAPDIDEILKTEARILPDDGENEKHERVRFESIIEFPYFLLHVLRVYVAAHRVSLPDDFKLQELLDDKRLCKEFDKVRKHGAIDGHALCENPEKFSICFIQCLLKCRYLFDKFLIKREYANESADGTWSLKQLGASRTEKKAGAYYKNTRLSDKGQWESTSEARNRNDLMLQAALRVSYTSPKVMHWVTDLMVWIYDDHNRRQLYYYEAQIEKIARDAVRENFLRGENYNLGVNTQHIVFNYLDYLLWKEDQTRYADFTFEFRNSVEHWYPQHPSQDTFVRWEQRDVDHFGNLCIISRAVNSKFSNLSPAAKKTTFGGMIDKGSLKLRRMAAQTSGNDAGGKPWKELYRAHGEAMIQKLKDACGDT